MVLYFAVIISLLFFLDRKYIWLHVLMFCLTSGFFTHLMLPWDDQYLLYNILKPIDFVSSFPGRELYSAYRIFPENSVNIQGLGGALLYWDYTYLPLSVVFSLFHLLFGIDPRIMYFIAYGLGCSVFIYFTDIKYQKIASLVLLISPLSFWIGVPSLSSTTFTPLIIALLFLGLLLIEETLTSSFLFSCSFLINQSSWPFIPFICIYSIKEKKVRPILISLIVLMLVTLYFSHSEPSRFLTSAILQHTSITDSEVFKASHQLSMLTLSGVIEFLFGFSSELIVAHLPRALLNFFCFFTLVYISFRSKNLTPQRVVLIGVLYSCLSVFILKISWLGTRYYLGPLTAVSMINHNSRIKVSNRCIQRFTFSFIVLAVSILVYSKIQVEELMMWNIGESRSYTPEIVSLSKRVSLQRRYGKVSSLSGSQFWIFTPPGKYQLKTSDQLLEDNITINEMRSFGLRIAFRIENDGSLILLPNDDVGFKYPDTITMKKIHGAFTLTRVG